MPQMAPMPWFFLLVLVLTSMFIFMSVVYSCPKSQSRASRSEATAVAGLNWKW